MKRKEAIHTQETFTRNANVMCSAIAIAAALPNFSNFERQVMRTFAQSRRPYEITVRSLKKKSENVQLEPSKAQRIPVSSGESVSVQDEGIGEGPVEELEKRCLRPSTRLNVPS